jgi:hypothetical protein
LCAARDPSLAAAFDAIESRVSRDPLAGRRFSEEMGGLYLMISSDSVDTGKLPMPVAKIVYRFNESRVAIMAARC